MVCRYCPTCWAENAYAAQVCRRCGASLDEGDKDFVSKLIDAIDHPEPTRAALAMDILGRQLQEQRAVVPLLRRLARQQDSIDAAEGAARALGAIGDLRAVPLLTTVLEDRQRPLAVRLAAAEALAELGGPEARQALQEAAEHRDQPRLLQKVLIALVEDEMMRQEDNPSR